MWLLTIKSIHLLPHNNHILVCISLMGGFYHARHRPRTCPLYILISGHLPFLASRWQTWRGWVDRKATGTYQLTLFPYPIVWKINLHNHERYWTGLLIKIWKCQLTNDIHRPTSWMLKTRAFYNNLLHWYFVWMWHNELKISHLTNFLSYSVFMFVACLFLCHFAFEKEPARFET